MAQWRRVSIAAHNTDGDDIVTSLNTVRYGSSLWAQVHEHVVGTLKASGKPTKVEQINIVEPHFENRDA